MQLAPNLIKYPDSMLATAEANKSFREYNVPQVCGATDGTHIKIVSPSPEKNIDYFSKKNKNTQSTRKLLFGQ